MKCEKVSCKIKPIIRFEYENHKDYYCLDHLVERLERIRDNDLFHLLKKAKKIIPIFSI